MTFLVNSYSDIYKPILTMNFTCELLHVFMVDFVKREWFTSKENFFSICLIKMTKENKMSDLLDFVISITNH